ncbi:hypothetical protein R5R35_013340 [Gryllus longicercus]|uniref:Uncharacterized protein n=1 Tax=Gryllus longicercus TaxID=2509291 RepID=A0AAN9YZU9_9ORTH
MNGDSSNPDQMVEDGFVPTTPESPPSEMNLPQLSALMSYLSVQDIREMQTQSVRGACHCSNSQPQHSSLPNPLTKVQSRQPQISNCSRRYDKYLHKINKLRQKCGLEPLKSSSTKSKSAEKKTRNTTNKTSHQKTGHTSNHTPSLNHLNQAFNCAVSRHDPLSKMRSHQSRISNCKMQFNNIRLQLKELKKMRSFDSPKSPKGLNVGEMKTRATGDETSHQLDSHCDEHTNVNHPVSPNLEEKCSCALQSFRDGETHSCQHQPLHSSLPDPVPREHSRPKRVVNCRLRYKKLLYHLKQLRKLQPVVAPSAGSQESKFGDKMTRDMGDETPHQSASPRGERNMNPLPSIQEEMRSETLTGESYSCSQMLQPILPDPLPEMQSHQPKIPMAGRVPDQMSCVINDLDKMSL